MSKLREIIITAKYDPKYLGESSILSNILTFARSRIERIDLPDRLAGDNYEITITRTKKTDKMNIKIEHSEIGENTTLKVFTNKGYRGQLTMPTEDFQALDEMLWHGASNSEHFYTEEIHDRQGADGNNNSDSGSLPNNKGAEGSE